MNDHRKQCDSPGLDLLDSASGTETHLDEGGLSRALPLCDI